jgi:hypothetical protein
VKNNVRRFKKMHEMMMLYEVGKQRMNEFIGDTERRMLQYECTPESEGVARKIVRSLTRNQYARQL